MELKRMELKDVILSTLAEIEELPSSPEKAVETKNSKEVMAPFSDERNDDVKISAISTADGNNDEFRMLEGIRERLLVLFEGFQSPNNAQIEAKVDLTLNFLEYLLATIDNRLETIKK